MRGAFYNLINFINTNSIDDVYANAAKIILKNIEDFELDHIFECGQCFHT